MAPIKRRVAVIGAGPAGVIATDALAREQAFDTIRVFERRNAAGGTWILTSDLDACIPSLQDLVEERADLPIDVPLSFPCETPKDRIINSHQLRYSDSAAHPHLHSNLPPEVMAFSQEPIPKVLSDETLARYGPDSPFRHREVMREWINAVLDRGDYDNLIEFGTTVERAEYTGNEWTLTLRTSLPGQEANSWRQETFDAVVVATGHYNVPYIPKIPGMVNYDKKYPGRIWHSKHYRTADPFVGKVSLTYSPDIGIPADHAELLKRVIVVGGSVSAFDALHDIRRVSKLPIISSLRNPSGVFGQTPFSHPHIDNRSEISAFDPETGRITFSDGSAAEDVDAILFATGFEFSFPFLPGVKAVNRRVPGLYQHVFKTDNPSLVFIGMVTGCFGIRAFEWQAVAAARVLAGHAALPPREVMEKWERDRLEERGDGPAFWALMPDFEVYFEAYRALAGDPAPGTRGRVLPKYDPRWAEIFWDFVNTRNEWWRKEAAEVEAAT
ncbi:thiol-specific monooxygenase [Xylariales sp. PMI_506]|nr:thiol-specific monooxygenase [Xylariales sp. PMI_506]